MIGILPLAAFCIPPMQTKEEAFMDKMLNVTVPAWLCSDAYAAAMKAHTESYNKLAQIGKRK